MTDARTAAEAYFHSLEARDWTALTGLLAEEVVYEMPQTRERITGRDRFLRFNQEYPGDWHLAVYRLVAEGRRAAAWIDARVAKEHQDACVWLEFDEAGRVVRVVDFWPEAYEPPAGREHLAERY
ncbi:nuclear transport factor 2 family protein [Glycomyces arizonensis]|uniref:nuclear transport factor 2 family protein n=1 Tax=Glycomyces arizonensis TaxID=256035 RepID=UPI000424428E|nr:nuclear transport factor 2 family protein [Glycomyces arizonensis]